MSEQTTETAALVKTETAVDLIKRANGTMKGLKPTQIQTILEAMKPQMKSALPGHMTPDRMIQMAATLIARNPKIAECTAQSLMGAVLQASLLGFKPVQALGECYFVPYNNKIKMPNGATEWRAEVQFQIGYKGWMALARRNPRVKSIYAYPVFNGDDFHYELGLAPTLSHKPQHKSSEVTHAYAVARLEGSDPVFVVLTKREIEKLRQRNSSQKDAPSAAWSTDYPAMACAKAIKQLVKWIPLGDDSDDEVLRRAAAADDAIIGRNAVVEDSLDADFFVDDISYPEAEVIEVKTPEFAKDPAMSPEDNAAAEVLFGNGKKVAKEVKP